MTLTGRKAEYGRGWTALIVGLPFLLAACQSSTPTELAAGLAEPAVVKGDAGPEVAAASQSVEQQEAAKLRQLATAAPHRIETAVDVQELAAPKRTSAIDAAPAVAPQPRTTAAPEKPALAPRSESDAVTKSAALFEWPVYGKIIETFGASEDGQRNDGINIAADTGTPIHAAADGVVTYASKLKGYGNLILIKHGNGYITAYAHAQKLLVSAGDQVDRGDVIGYAGTSGGIGTPQVHFEIRKGTTPVDPQPLMMAARDS